MTAAVLEECGKPLQLLDLEIPKLKRGQVLVKIAYSAICRSQLMEISGHRGPDKWLPHLLGHEASGTVADVGPEVTKVAPGDDVILTWIRSAGIESDTPEYTHNGRTINAGPITTFSTYSIVSENRVVLKPCQLDMDVAVLFGCALATGSGMVLNELKPTATDSVIVLGLGGVGMAALLTLIATKAKNLIAVDTDPLKCEMARSFGATAILCKSKKELRTSLRNFLRNGADYCIEAGGSTQSIELGFSLLNPAGGTLLFASHPAAGKKIRLNPHELITGKKIKGSSGGRLQPDSDIPAVANLFCDNELPISELIKNKFSLRDINEAVHMFMDGKTFRPILVMD